MRQTILALAISVPFLSAPAVAAIDTYTAFLYGSNQIPTPGDPDGFGVATVSIDNVGLTTSWSILALNVDFPLTGAHIHAGPAGTNGPVIVDFSGQLTGTGLSDPDLASITPLTASSFYVNIHNSIYPGGAIRGQLQYVGTAALVPEPDSYALMIAGLGVVGFMLRRRNIATL